MIYDVIASGYVSMDRVIKIGSPAKVGFTSIVKNKDNARINYGGCSTNICYLLAKLNKKALPMIRLGELDTKELGFYDYLKDAGVCMDAVELVKDEATSNCYLLLDEEKNHITIFYPGAQDGKYSKPMDKEFFEQSKYAVITVGAYEDNVEFFNKCRETKTPLIFGMKSDFEAFPVDFLKEILLYSEIIFTNEVEREEIEKLYSLNSITDLFDKGNARVIITTLGKKGSMYYEKTDEGIKTGTIGAAEENPVVDTTGSGDAYIAGFIYGLLENMSIEQCCNRGSVLSSFIIEKMGCITNAPTLEQYNERYKRLIK